MDVSSIQLNRGGLADVRQFSGLGTKPLSPDLRRSNRRRLATVRMHPVVAQGTRNPSNISPLILFSSLQRLSSNFCQRHLEPGVFPARHWASCNQPNCEGGLPVPENTLFSTMNSICHASAAICATTKGRGVLTNLRKTRPSVRDATSSSPAISGAPVFDLQTV